MNSRYSAGVLALALLVPCAAFAQDKKETEPTAEDALKQKLKTFEDKLVEMRTAMLKDCDDAIKKADAAVKKAQKDLTDAGEDREAHRKARAAVQKAQQERNQLAMIRLTAEHRIHVPTRLAVKPRKPLPPEEQRLGILPTHITAALSKQLGLKKDEGAVVEMVTANSPAAKAGVQQYDILVKIDGKPVPASMSALRKLLAGVKTDTPFEAVVIRQGKQETVKGLTISGDPDQPKKPDPPEIKKPDPKKPDPADPTKPGSKRPEPPKKDKP